VVTEHEGAAEGCCECARRHKTHRQKQRESDGSTGEAGGRRTSEGEGEEERAESRECARPQPEAQSLDLSQGLRLGIEAWGFRV
jgi:hypothetical protein